MIQPHLPVRVRESMEQESAGYYLKVDALELGLPKYVNKKIAVYVDPHEKVTWGDLVVVWDDAGQYRLRAVLPIVHHSTVNPCGVMLQGLNTQETRDNEPPVSWYPGDAPLPLVHRVIGIEWPKDQGISRVIAGKNDKSPTGVNTG